MVLLLKMAPVSPFHPDHSGNIHMFHNFGPNSPFKPVFPSNLAEKSNTCSPTAGNSALNNEWIIEC